MVRLQQTAFAMYGESVLKTEKLIIPIMIHCIILSVRKSLVFFDPRDNRKAREQQQEIS